MGGILDMHLGWILTFILAQKLYFIFHATLTVHKNYREKGGLLLGDTILRLFHLPNGFSVPHSTSTCCRYSAADGILS